MSNEQKELQTYSPQGLLSQALAQNVPMETLERLMDLQERWDAKQAKSAYLIAMSKFQSKCPVFKKKKKVDYPSKTGGNVRYNYTELGDATNQIRDLLNECGLSYRWEFMDKEEETIVNGKPEKVKKIECICIISHVDGHSEKCTMTAEKDTTGNKNNIQSIGSTRTYLQRYTLVGGLGLSSIDEDNDGQSATTQKPTTKIPEPKSIDKIEMLISKITVKTNDANLSKLDSLIGNEGSVSARKRYLDLLSKQLKKVDRKYEIITKAE